MFGISDNKNQDGADDPYVMPAPAEPASDTAAPAPAADPAVDQAASAQPSADYTAPTEPAASPAASNDYTTATEPSAPPAFAPSAPPMPAPPPEISSAVPAMPTPSDTPAPDPLQPTPAPDLGDKPSAAALMGGGSDDHLLKMKQQALQSLAPLVDHLEQTPEEKFKTTMMLIQASDNADLVKEAYEAANQIKDDKARAQALLDVVNEINYFTQTKKNSQT